MCVCIYIYTYVYIYTHITACFVPCLFVSLVSGNAELESLVDSSGIQPGGVLEGISIEVQLVDEAAVTK